MSDRDWERWGALAGVLIIVLFVIAIFATGSPPKPTDTNDAVKAFLVDKRGGLLLQSWLFAFGGALLVFWAAAIRSVLRRGEGPTGLLANTFYGTNIATSALLITLTALQAGFVYKAMPSLDPAVARAVFDIGGAIALLFSFLLFVGGLALAVVTLRSGALPAWVGWIAVAAAVVNLVGTLTIFSKTGAFSAEGVFGFAPFAANMVFILSVSVTAARGREVAQPA